MDQATIDARATQLGVSGERIERYLDLGLQPHQFKQFSYFKDDVLEELIGYRIPAAELYRIVQDRGCDADYIIAYAKLREQGFTDVEIRLMKQPKDVLVGLEAKIPRPYVLRADQEEIPILNLLDGVRAQIPFEHMFEAAGVRNVPTLYVYIQARQNHHSHKHLMEILRHADPDEVDFDLVSYQKARTFGEAHNKIVKMLRDLHGRPKQRLLYLEYITARPGLMHKEALALAVHSVSLGQYFQVRHQGLSHKKIMKGLDQGLSIQNLDECADFLNNNCRISFEEVVQYYGMFGYLYDINDYIKLLKAGYLYEEVKEAHDLEVSMIDYGKLRAEPMALSHEDVMTVIGLGIDPQLYMKRRESGDIHAMIIEDA